MIARGAASGTLPAPDVTAMLTTGMMPAPSHTQILDMDAGRHHR